MNNVEINGGLKLRFTVAMIVSNQQFGKYRLRQQIVHATFMNQFLSLVKRQIFAFR